MNSIKRLAIGLAMFAAFLVLPQPAMAWCDYCDSIP